jgi:hypothetical protein
MQLRILVIIMSFLYYSTMAIPFWFSVSMLYLVGWLMITFTNISASTAEARKLDITDRSTMATYKVWWYCVFQFHCKGYFTSHFLFVPVGHGISRYKLYKSTQPSNDVC